MTIDSIDEDHGSCIRFGVILHVRVTINNLKFLFYVVILIFYYLCYDAHIIAIVSHQ